PGLNQARRKLTPILPESNSFDIPDGYQTTASGEPFLICDKLVSRKKRMLFFGSPNQLQLLFDSSIIFLDGTFRSTPPFFDQIFTIHGLKFDCGCYFYYSQCLYRRIQSLGLAKAYSQDESVRSCCRKLMALLLLPIQEVETSFYNLRAAADPTVKQQLRELFLHFDEY
ncbi:unnamed protein product, partial [Rotaria socialis]